MILFWSHLKNFRKNFSPPYMILPPLPTIKHGWVTIIINCQTCNNLPVPDLQPCSSSSMGGLWFCSYAFMDMRWLKLLFLDFSLSLSDALWIKLFKTEEARFHQIYKTWKTFPFISRCFACFFPDILFFLLFSFLLNILYDIWLRNDFTKVNQSFP